MSEYRVAIEGQIADNIPLDRLATHIAYNSDMVPGTEWSAVMVSQTATAAVVTARVIAPNVEPHYLGAYVLETDSCWFSEEVGTVFFPVQVTIS